MMDNEKIKGAARNIKMSDEDKKRITENVVKSSGSPKRKNKGLLIGAGAAAAVCIISVSAFAIAGGFGGSNVPIAANSTTSETLTGTYSVPETKAEGGTDNGKEVHLENSGTGFETSTADEEENNKPQAVVEQESKAVDHETKPGAIIPSEQGDWIPAKWNGIYCDPGLYKELSVWNGTEQAFAVAVEMIKYNEEEFRGYAYNGKSVNDILGEIGYYSNCSDDLQKIQQYVLGNGTPLSEIEKIDEEFRAQYLVDGKYDQDKINYDIGKYLGLVKDTSVVYDEAYSAFRNEKLAIVSDELKNAGINAELKEDGLLHFICGGEQLSKINLTDSENYCFSLDYNDIENDVIYEMGEDQEE